MRNNKEEILRLLRQRQGQSQETDKERILRLLAEERAQRGGTATVVSSVPEATAVAEHDNRFFKAGAFSDGYQFGDVVKTILGTLHDANENVTEAVFDATENLIDTTAYGVGAIGGLFDKGFKDDVGKFIAKEILKPKQTGETVATYGNPTGWLNLLVNGGKTEENSVLGDKADGLVQSGSHLAGSYALQLVGVPSWLTMGVNAFGSEIESAFQQDATYAEAGISGAVSAVAEVVFEKLSSGIKFKGASADEGLQHLLKTGIKNKLGRTIAKYAVDAVGEGTEEVLTEAASAVGRKMTYLNDKEWNEILSREDLFDAFVGGAIMSGVLGGGKIAHSAKTGRDYTSGLTANEEKVVNKLYEDKISQREKNGKLTAGEKTKIYNGIVEEMERGRISTDTIESVLGGDTYKGYQNALAQESKLKKEIEELESLADNAITVKQRERLTEARKQLEGLDTKTAKANLFSQVDKLTAKDTKIRESYNERTRRGQAFTADLAKYDSKQQETVKRAIESGILNNTNRTHEFVDLIAKISANKGVSFNFADNAKLKESGFALDGKQVNGFVTADGVTININSAKALNSVVGHEITHVLEGTELYNELQSAIVEYAKSKGDYQGRYDTLSELYKGIEGADIDAELTADLVGDYLFTDADFVQRLSTEHRGVFQKLFDEIKHLCKLATAGTKEARELEKVKKLFEDAYRTETKNPTADGGVKYSLNIEHIDGTVEELTDLRDLTDEQAIRYLESAQAFELLDETYIPVRRELPQVIIDSLLQENINVANRSLVMQAGKARRLMRKDTNRANGKRGHGLTPRQIVDIINDIENPVKIFYQTNRVGQNGESLPDNVAIFVKYSKNGVNGFATVEFENPERTEAIGREFGETNFYTVNTAFFPDTTKNGKPFNYMKQLEDNPDNIELEIKRRQSEDSANWKKHPSTTNELPFNNSIRNPDEKVNGKFSLNETEGAAPAGGYRITGEDIALAPTREDIARMEQGIATAQNAPRNDNGVQDAPDSDAEELGAPTREDIARMDRDKKLKGPLLMKDSLDRELEKLYRLQQLNQIQDNAYFVELFKVNAAYQAEGRDFTEAFNRVIGAYQEDVETQATVENKNSHISLEDYANSESPVWRNVAYNDDATKTSIMQSTHDVMVAEGSVVSVTQDVIDTVEQSFPDLRSMKKKERTPILKDAINKLKNNIRQFLTGLSNQNFEFEVNGKVLDAKLYSTGINEVLEKVTQEKANMLYSTEEIFRNARYLYSTPDYDGDPNVYRWNYFYTPVQIGDEIVGVRIAVRDVATPRESQIYNWGIKKDASLGGVGRGTNNRISHGASSDASTNNIPEDVAGVKYSVDESVAEEMGVPNREDIMRMEAEKELHGPWRMTDELDQRVEKLYRMMLREEVSEEDYVAQLVKADRLYQQRGSKVEEALERVREAYSKETTETPETEKKMERLTRKVLHKGIMDRIRDALAKAGFDLNTILKNAKNLSTFATVDNTPQRVNEKTFGYKAGQIINDLTVNKAALNESAAIQWLNGQIDKIRKMSERYGIKPGSKESRAAQIYGEGFWVNEVGEYIQYGDAELAADFPDSEKQAKIKALAKSQEVRQMYDDTLDAINAARVRNGYPPIPRRDNYFLHFRAQDDTFSRIGVPFNPNDVRAKDLPTDLNGVTADLKPGKPFFASEMRRTGDKTTYDLLGGLERYMNSAKNQIYHIDDIQTLRAMRNYIADMFGQANGLADLDSLSPEEQEQRIKEVFDNHLSTYAKFLNEEANIFAGKTALIDRGVEGVLGRRAIQFLHTLNGQVGKNMVGYNASSAGTNVLPVVQATAMLPKADMVKAFAQTISNKFRSDGFVESDPALIRRKGADQFTKTLWQRLSDPGYALMSAVDNLSSELIVRAKYNELTRKGMDSQQAHIRAGEWASRLMGDRSLGQMPQLYNSKTLGLITKFQLEVRNQLDAMGYDVIQEAKAEEGVSNVKKAAKVASTMAQLAIFQQLFGQAYEAIAGYNPAFDIVENLIKLFGFDDEEESEDTFGDNVEQAFLGLLEDLPYTSTFTGGRIPIASALPVKEVITGKDSYGNEKNRIETLAGALPYYILPGGYGQAKKTAQGLKMFDEDLPVAGSYTDSGNLRFPVEDDSIADWLQAALFGQYAGKNARDYFDNGWAPLKEKQIEEFAALDIPIADYREIRKQLGKLGTTGEKLAYIHTLDLPISKKNILANNLTNRKTPIDMADWGKLEEFDYAVKYPEKAQFLVANGISVKEYNNFDDETKDAYDWAYLNPEKYAVSKTVSNDIVTYRKYTQELSEIKADKDSKGKTVSGSRKKKVVQYINGLDMDYGAKLVLYKMEYPSDDTYNGKIIQYVNDIEGFTFEQKATVLKELGFTVTSDGKVAWN